MGRVNVQLEPKKVIVAQNHKVDEHETDKKSGIDNEKKQESSKSANFAAPEVVAVERTHQEAKTGSNDSDQLGPDLLNLGPNGLLSSLGKYASAVVQVVQGDQDVVVDKPAKTEHACGTPNFLISSDVVMKCSSNGMECLFSCRNDKSIISSPHALCVHEDDQWSWRMVSAEGKLISLPFFEVTCSTPADVFDFSTLIEQMLIRGTKCKPIQENFAILGTPLIKCNHNECSFHCLSGLHHGAKEVNCQKGKWVGAFNFVACLDF